MATKNTFTYYAKEIIGHTGTISINTENRRFKSIFGILIDQVCLLWLTIQQNNNSLCQKASPKHLLWCLLFLKLYVTESVAAILCGCDEKTFRKWVWLFIEEIAKLPCVS